MAYAVARRTGEIGMRMALGAEQRNIIWIVRREVFALAAAGLVIELAAGYTLAWRASRIDPMQALRHE